MADNATTGDFREIIKLLREAREASNTGEKADQLLKRAERLVGRSSLFTHFFDRITATFEMA